MLAALFHRAEAAVDNAIGLVLTRVLLAIPFLVAVGFATAAATSYAVRELGPEAGYLVVAAVFAVIGVIASAIVFASSPAARTDDVAGLQSTSQSPEETRDATPEMSSVDRELIMTALTSTAPLALPALINLVVRNFPIVAALLAIIYVLSRPSPEVSDPEAEKAAVRQ